MIPDGLQWNQAELAKGHALDRGLVSLVSLDEQSLPTLIGTGFIISATGRTAVACTAAHNFQAIAQSQVTYQISHSSALREFLPNVAPLSVDKTRLRAVCTDGSHPEMAIIDWVVWDPPSDIAFFGLRTQNDNEKSYFSTFFFLDDRTPKVGDEVAVLGYEGMEILQATGGADMRFTMARRPLLRLGRVAALHIEGHILCRGPCIETTIPVFPGMSGGPVMLFGAASAPMKPVGVISFDADGGTDKRDRSIRGYGTFALLRPAITVTGEKQQRAVFELRRAITAGIDSARSSHDETR
jgi:hypothetical protein